MVAEVLAEVLAAVLAAVLAEVVGALVAAVGQCDALVVAWLVRVLCCSAVGAAVQSLVAPGVVAAAVPRAESVVALHESTAAAQVAQIQGCRHP